MPERRLDADRKTWMIPLTRAGALAILALAEDHDELVITKRVRHALKRSAVKTASGRRPARFVDVLSTPASHSPVAHWRHYTEGPVFENPRRRRVNVPGVGWCVRIRVNPRDHSDDARPGPTPRIGA